MKDSLINIKLLEIYRLVEELPDCAEKKQILIKIDEAIMWFERIDPFEDETSDVSLQEM